MISNILIQQLSPKHAFEFMSKTHHHCMEYPPIGSILSFLVASVQCVDALDDVVCDSLGFQLMKISFADCHLLLVLDIDRCDTP